LEKQNNWKLGQEIADLRDEIDSLKSIEKEVRDIAELQSLQDESLQEEIKDRVRILEKKIEIQETNLFLSGRYDKGPAIMEIFSGAGGVDAQDWATILLRMYVRYAEEKGFNVKIIEQSFGEGGGPEGRIGTKSAVLEIRGKYAFGLLKRETGVHRLVRQSPFSAKKLRHTSFALVNVIPEINKEDQEIRQLAEEVKEDDLKIDYFRSSGPGGQNVNKRETAVRITHIPTGIVVSSQVERLQGSNRARAMDILYAKLYQQKQEEKEKELKKLKGEAVSASWGNQIRSYVLHPYKMVKDLRTGVETSNAESVLDGDLDKFIKTEIKYDFNK
jgi:peptide chain release factor 2